MVSMGVLRVFRRFPGVFREFLRVFHGFSAGFLRVSRGPRWGFSANLALRPRCPRAPRAGRWPWRRPDEAAGQQTRQVLRPQKAAETKRSEGSCGGLFFHLLAGRIRRFFGRFLLRRDLLLFLENPEPEGICEGGGVLGNCVKTLLCRILYAWGIATMLFPCLKVGCSPQTTGWFPFGMHPCKKVDLLRTPRWTLVEGFKFCALGHMTRRDCVFGSMLGLFGAGSP